MKNNMSAKRLALIGMLGALGAILMMFRFPIPFMPPFLSFDLAAIPELIGAFALGPVAGVLIVFIRVMVQMVIPCLPESCRAFCWELPWYCLRLCCTVTRRHERKHCWE